MFSELKSPLSGYQYASAEPSGEYAGLNSSSGWAVSLRSAPPATSACQSVERSLSPLNVFSTRVKVTRRPSRVHAICGEKMPPGSVGAIVHDPDVMRRGAPPAAGDDPEVVGRRRRGGRVVVVAGEEVRGRRLIVGRHVCDAAPVGTPRRIDHVAPGVRQAPRRAAERTNE